MIDNYDSFTYNLYQYLCELGAEVEVVRNDKISLEEIEDMSPEGIIISPGPSTPLEAGISNDVIRQFGPKTPTLGVCLGHQCIGYVYGAKVDQAGEIRHGKTSMVSHNGAGVLAVVLGPAEEDLGLGVAVVGVDLIDSHDRLQRPVGCEERDARTGGGRVRLVNAERDWQGPDVAVGELHAADDAVEIGFAHEADQWAERADADHLDIAGLLG